MTIEVTILDLYIPLILLGAGEMAWAGEAVNFRLDPHCTKRTTPVSKP
jgi:hypothetical protein